MQPRKKLITGTIKRNADGFGFLIPDDHEHPDVYIPRSSMEGVMTSDKVQAEVEPERGGERFRGEIVRVISRGFKTIVGQFTKVDHAHGIIRDEGKGWGQDLKIRTEDNLNANQGQLVAAQIVTYPDDKKGFYGRVTEVIGSAQDPMNDIRRVLLVNNIPHDFSPACLREAAGFSEKVKESDFKNRKDLRSLNLITIDGATAKDFDDAIYVESNAKGFLLYVAIADVSHYVQVDSAIDKDAYERGTSVYYPNYVTPMLPEVLSNGLCSLMPHVPRLALVAEMQMNFDGELQSSKFYEAVMESKARVTYGEAQEIIEGQKLEKLKHVQADILRAADLAKILMAKRFREGSLDLEIPETQLLIDAGGNPIDVIRSERLFAHRLIEEMMLAANVAVAKFFNEKNIPALYRIHESPNTDAIGVLEKYLETFGGHIDLHSGKLQKRLTHALQEFEGKPQALILNILTLRSMAQAKYSPNNVGHFGLGFEFYTHFTSPIRRYPDLIVHRLIKNLILPNSQYRLMSEDDLASAGTMLSACEQRAVKSERQLISIKKARFMQKHLGEELDGMVSSVTKFGLFVLLRGFEVDGLIRMERLGHGYEFDEETLQLRSRRSGHSYGIGDMIRVQVESVDVEAGQINFQLAANGKDSDKENSNSDSLKADRRDSPPRRDRNERGPRHSDREPNRNQKSGRRQERPPEKSGRPDPSNSSNPRGPREDQPQQQGRRKRKSFGKKKHPPRRNDDRPVSTSAEKKPAAAPESRNFPGNKKSGSLLQRLKSRRFGGSREDKEKDRDENAPSQRSPSEPKAETTRDFGKAPPKIGFISKNRRLKKKR
jgi:ribonuclease R